MSESDDLELLDIVDEQDRVIGVAQRRKIHLECLMHRSVHVFLVDECHGLYLQKRSASKQEFPGVWDSSAAGHLRRGETYAEAAARELAEELGIQGVLHRIAKVPATDQTGYEHVVLYAVYTQSGAPVPNPNPYEIEEGRFFSFEEIQKLLAEHMESVTPSFRILFRLYQHYTTGGTCT